MKRPKPVACSSLTVGGMQRGSHARGRHLRHWSVLLDQILRFEIRPELGGDLRLHGSVIRKDLLFAGDRVVIALGNNELMFVTQGAGYVADQIEQPVAIRLDSTPAAHAARQA